MAHPQLSIVIPAFNESARIEHTLERIMVCINSRQWDAEVLIVDDGSEDATATIVKRWMAIHPQLSLLRNRRNRGKGYSVRRGLLHAAGDIVMFTDADLSAPLEEADRLIAAIHDGADVAIGSRWLDRSTQTTKQPLYRQIFGRCFNRITRTVLDLPFHDTQCGFKAFRRAAARVIFRLQTIERWGFDPEMLLIARTLGFDVREVSVRCGHDDRTRVRYVRDGIRMLAEIAMIWANSTSGVYDRTGTAYPEESVTAEAHSPSRPVAPLHLRR